MTRDARLDALALGSNCHRCAAPADQPCRTPSARITRPHQARINRAVAQHVTAKRVAEIEAVAEAAEPQAEEPAEFVGEIEPTCPSCLYLSGHTSWCPNSPTAGMDGEIRRDEHGVARYWTAAEIAELRAVEAAAREAEIDALVEEGCEEIAADDAAYAEPLTPAHVLAAATGHPSGEATRRAFPV